MDNSTSNVKSENDNKKKKVKNKTIDIVYIALFAALTAICAQIAIPMAIPFTLQTLAICLSAALLGYKRGIISLIIYILLGIIGVPVFAGFKSGAAVITGPTGGYIIGFFFTVFIVGIMAEKIGKKVFQLTLFMIMGIAACYIFGTIWFIIAYKVTLASAVTTCVLPFILPDCAKAIVAAVLTSRLKKFVK